MRRLFIRAGCLAFISTSVGCTVVRQQRPTFNLAAEIGGCELTVYRLPPRVPYRELDGQLVITGFSNDERDAEAILARNACSAGANAVILTHEAPSRNGMVATAVFIRTEPGTRGESAPESQPATPGGSTP